MEILFISNIQNFKKYGQFKSLKDFNNNIEQYMVEYKHIFTKSELIALKRLARYSAKIPGLCNARINTILETINDKSNGYGISRSTFKRMISKSKRIGLLEVKETVRANMSQSSNLYIFQRFNTIEPPRKAGEKSKKQVKILSEQHPIQKKDVSTIEPPYKTNNIKTSNIKTTSVEIDHTYLPSFIDSSFIETVKPFFNAEFIYKLWHRVQIAYKKSGVTKTLSEIIGVINKAFKETVFMKQVGKVKSSFEGYFYRLMENYLAVEKRKENKHVLYNWLES